MIYLYLFGTCFHFIYVFMIIGKYYKESPFDILSVIKDIEFGCKSKRYRIQWVKCLGDHYLVLDKR